jgi:LuxR family transcriptional regulator, maltose regulon positive regulatory protein
VKDWSAVTDTITRQPRRPQPPLCPHLGARVPVPRAALLDLLEASGSTTVVAILAPPGYGKTTLLASWAERDPRSFAWLTIDHHDNDPAALLQDIAATLNQIEPLDPALLETLRLPGRAAVNAVLPQLGSAVSGAALPVVLVLDDLHLLQSWDCLEVVAKLIDYLPPGSQLAIASRGEPPLPLARLRAEGRVLQIGPEDLAMDQHEAHTLLANGRAPRRPERRFRAGPTDRGLAGGAPVRGLVLATFP